MVLKEYGDGHRVKYVDGMVWLDPRDELVSKAAIAPAPISQALRDVAENIGESISNMSNLMKLL